MLIKKIVLENIRSYAREELTFPEGSTLLAGDIGSGKSSILLAIEFALFGAARPDLPAEALLRKGTSMGSVELTFALPEKQIIIKRGLKKEKAGIKQLPGYLVVNNLKKELMPVELKAEVLNLLGYPDDVLTKNKNYLYRYTVYTPQEEMKLVLQEQPEVRLDVLRKVFGVDKYKNIRDMLQGYLRTLRTQIAVLEAKREPLQEIEERERVLRQEEEQRALELQDLIQRYEAAQTEVRILASSLQEMEAGHNEFTKLQQQLRLKEIERHGKKEQDSQENLTLAALREELQLLVQPGHFQISPGFLPLLNKETQALLYKLYQEDIPQDTMEALSTQITVALRSREEEHTRILQQRSEIQTELTMVQQRMTAVKQELHPLEGIFSKLITVKEQRTMLEQEIVKLDPTTLEQNARQLQTIVEQMVAQCTKQTQRLEQAGERISSIDRLELCPHCLQKVPEEHKIQIKAQEEESIKNAQEQLRTLEQQRQEILQQQQEVREQQKRYDVLQRELALIMKEEEITREKAERYTARQREFSELLIRNATCLEQWRKLKDATAEEKIQRELQEGYQLRDLLRQRDALLRQIREGEQRLRRIQQQLQVIDQETESLYHALDTKKDLSLLIEEQKKKAQEARQQEQNMAVQRAQLEIKQQHSDERRKELLEELEKIQKVTQRLTRGMELHQWLQTFFLPLTVTIEKHIMLQVHRLFNELFQEWFSILIDDPTMFTRLDDSFSPVIEQNGHEIDFAHLSGGERTSASLAYRLALNRVINDVIHQIQTKDVLILDEPTDGFSSEQLDKIWDVLERLQLRQTIIVSHESKIESFVENVLRVQKQGHESVVIM